MVRFGRNFPELVWLRSARGQRIGLFGGSFDPVHQGHWLCAEQLRKKNRLSQVWWLPTARNPLKMSGAQQSYARRYAQVESVLKNSPYHRASHLLGTGEFLYTIDFLRFLQILTSSNTLVWLSGSDVFGELHRWKNWRELIKITEISVYSRPGHALSRTGSPAHQSLRKYPLVLGKRMQQSSRDIRRIHTQNQYPKR